MEEKNFGKLGFTFQQQLIKSIIEDKKYGEVIIEYLDPKYFDNNAFRYIVTNIKELFDKYKVIPDYPTLEQKIMNEGSKDSTVSAAFTDTLKVIKEQGYQVGYTKDTALNFCKQQNLIKELKKVQSIIDSGSFEEYHTIEEIIQKSLAIGLNTHNNENVFNDIEASIEKDNRLPIPTGVNGLDSLLKGGLGKGELGIVLAPTGTGKTTILTKFANTAYNYGLNVLQIFFEDNKNDIKRKHYTIWSKISPDEQSLPQNKQHVIEQVVEAQNRSNGRLELLKLSSDDITVGKIKAQVRKMISEGFNIDLLIIDYVDCISPEKTNYNEEWKGEGTIMRSLESMTSEFNIAIWTATQGSRDSIAAEMVNTNQMGGSIKKAQIAHVIITIARTMPQKEENLATIALTKSRIGKDGIVWENCKFNNEYLEIDTDTQNTLLGFKENKERENAQDQRNRLAAANQRAREFQNRPA